MRSSPPRCFSAGASVEPLEPPPPSYLFPEIDQPQPCRLPPQPLHPPVPLSFYFPEIEYQHPPLFPRKEEHPTSPTASKTRDSDGEDNQRSTVDAKENTLSSYAADEGSYCMRLVKIYCKGDPLLHVSIRKGRLILAHADPLDPFQWWLKDEKHARIKDEDGFPCFALVSKATRQAIGCKTPEYEEPLQLIEYDPTAVDACVLWTEGRDPGSGYRTVRLLASNIQLIMNAHAGVTMGTFLQLFPGGDGDNELWRITTMKKFIAKT